MTDPWHSWDEHVHASGRPARVAQELTDAELLNLLANDEPDRDVEKRILKEEAYRRMHAEHHRTSESVPPTPSTGTFSEPSHPGRL